MSKKSIRVWFLSPTGGFGHIIARTLADDYEVREGRDFCLSKGKGLAEWCDVVLLDLQPTETPEAEIRFMEEINRRELPSPLVVMLGEDDRNLMLKVMEKGAYDCVNNPPDIVELRLILRRAYKFQEAQKELFELRRKERSGGQMHGLLGVSEGMSRVFALSRKIAPCDVSVLVTGETGTGKELLARAVHRLSPRSEGPFVAFSCVNLPETLVEDELFGHERGAFTGAVAIRRGRFEAADGGTLFLDEIGDLSLTLQSKLLRVIQERSFERLGSNRTMTANIRLVCATHRNLAEMVERGEFREDLYYRLNVVQIHLPRLSERRDDIPVLADHFLRRFASQFGKKRRRISPAAMHALEEYDWPGNVRELENVVQRGLVIAEGASIEVRDLPARLRKGFDSATPLQLAASYEDEVRGFKRRLILRTLRECGNRKAEAARNLGLARSYLHRLINQLEIPPDQPDTTPEVFDDPPPTNRLM